MSATAIIMMVVTMTTVTAFTVYFFWRVLRPPARPGADSRKEPES